MRAIERRIKWAEADIEDAEEYLRIGRPVAALWHIYRTFQELTEIEEYLEEEKITYDE